MGDSELKQRIATHQGVIAELNMLAPEVEAYQMRVSQFILKNPILAGLPYSGVEILMKEKDPGVTYRAMKVIMEELRTRRDPETPGYRFKYRVMTDSRVRKIILECRPSEDIAFIRADPKRLAINLICPNCHKEIQYTPVKRDEVVSFRGTVMTDDALDYLATAFGVSRSLLTSTLLSIEQKFGYGLKK